VVETTKRITGRFKLDAESFYDTNDRNCGYIATHGRDGREFQAPLITVSSVILQLPDSIRCATTAEDIGNIIADLKKTAKTSSSKICISGIADRLSPPLPRASGIQ